MRNIKVTLISKPDFDPITMIGGLAKLTQIKEEFSEVSRERGELILKAVYAMGHTSLLECADFGFILSGTSRVFLSQITRHRLASYTSQSQQYQGQENFPAVVPASIYEDTQSYQIFTEAMHHADMAYKELKRRGIPQDDARYVIPGAARNDLYIKMNGRELIVSMIPQRACRRNTAETLHVVRLMLRALVDAGFNDFFKISGPACLTAGKCDQGKWCCKRPFTSWEELVDAEGNDNVSSSVAQSS